MALGFASLAFAVATTPALAAGVLLAVAGRRGNVVAAPSRWRRATSSSTACRDAFEGFRVVQISDLHCGPFASGPRVAGWIDGGGPPAARSDRGHRRPDRQRRLPSCRWWQPRWGGLRAPHGVFASMGNHDYFTEPEALAEALEAAGLSLLRNRGVEVERGGAGIFVAGVDDTWTRRDDLARALADRPSGDARRSCWRTIRRCSRRRRRGAWT
jgi:predicted MPP superfamily phosphohydrolase